MKKSTIWNKVLSQGEVVEYEFSINPRYTKIWLAIWSFVFLIFYFGLLESGGASGVVILYVIALVYYGYYLKASNTFAFTNKRVLIHKGLFSTHMTSIEYSKITDVTVVSRFWANLIYKSGSLVINTAGTSVKDTVLRNINRPYQVKKIMDQIINR